MGGVLASAATRANWMRTTEGLDIAHDNGNPEKARGATRSSLSQDLIMNSVLRMKHQ